MHIVNVTRPPNDFNEVNELRICQKHLLSLQERHETTRCKVGVIGTDVEGICEHCQAELNNPRRHPWNPPIG